MVLKGGINPLNLGINKTSNQNALSQQIVEILRSLGSIKGTRFGRGSIGLPDTEFPATTVLLKQRLASGGVATSQLSADSIETPPSGQDVIKQLDAQLFHFQTAGFSNNSQEIRFDSDLMAHMHVGPVPHRLGRIPKGIIAIPQWSAQVGDTAHFAQHPSLTATFHVSLKVWQPPAGQEGFGVTGGITTILSGQGLHTNPSGLNFQNFEAANFAFGLEFPVQRQLVGAAYSTGQAVQTIYPFYYRNLLGTLLLF